MMLLMIAIMTLVEGDVSVATDIATSMLLSCVLYSGAHGLVQVGV